MASVIIASDQAALQM